jgi:hypothetical protein
MDIGLSFSFPFEDEKWVQKLLIGAVIVLVGIITLGILLLPVVGWGLEIVRRMIRDERPILPEWQDFGQLFVDGLKIFALAFVWSLPIILISACFGLVAGFAGAAGSGGGYGSNVQNVTSSLVSLVITCISLPYGLAVSILLPAAMGILADTGDFGRTLNPSHAFRLVRDNIGTYLLAWLVGAVAMFVLQIVGTIACLIGYLPAFAYGTAVVSHLYGQAYRVATTNVEVMPEAS